MWLVEPEEPTTNKITAGEAVRTVVDAETADKVFAALHAAGYRISVTRFQWR